MRLCAMQIMLLTLLVGGNTACSSLALAHPQWLAILATRTSLADAVIEIEKLRGQTGGLDLISTKDCRNLRSDLFLVVAGVLGDRQSAVAATDSWRTKGVNDAYVRACDIVEHSRLAFGLPLLDPSFGSLHTRPVNWDLDDAMSRVESLDDGGVVLIAPYYEADPEDIREGLKIKVLLHQPAPEQPFSLSADCIDPEFAANRNYLALSCVTESAADQLLHRIQVFNLDDEQVVAVHDKCRKPRFRSGVLVCMGETVDAEGKLSLKERHYPVVEK